jgi:hypothetical protein
VKLQDGQAIYPISFKIKSSMTVGIWKLVSVDIGRSTFTKMPVPDDELFLNYRYLHLGRSTSKGPVK